MSDPLATYLHDHLAGAVHAIELLEALEEQHKSEPIGEFASRMLIEIKTDRDSLRMLAEQVGVGDNSLKEMTAWLGEKVSRLKLNHRIANGLGTFEALEFLELGIHGKWALWRALAVAAETDVRLQEVDFEQLVRRAETQRDQVEERRLQLARIALRPASH